MATSSNPRKFSEKIALHNQKQAEETAAFDEVMKDLSITRAARLQKTQYLQLGPTRGQYYGGSLPNVNQISSSIDLPFQTPFQTSGHDTSRTTRHHGLVERVYRDRTRITSPHQRPLGLDKHGRQIDSCPYGAVYLSPPPDTSWRRTNSDSALHQSTLPSAPAVLFTGDSQELQPKRVPGTEGKAAEGKEGQKHTWEGKKNASRSKPCKVPGINIFLSPDQELSSSVVPSNNSGGGSLPDLTNIQFPPPLPTPLDPEDHGSLGTSNSTGNLASTLPHSSQGVASMQARQDNIVPPITNADANQLSPTLSPPLTLAQALAIDTLTLEQQLSQYAFFSPASSQGQNPDLDPNQPPPGLIQLLQNPDLDPGQPPPGLAQLLQQLPCLTSASQTQSSVGMDVSSHNSILSSVFSDFYDQQLSSRQTSALSQQLEQFNMMDGSLGSAPLYSPASTLNYAQAAMMGLTSNHGNLQDSPQLGYSNHGNIPNIILTVTEESASSLAKELATLSADSSFDVDVAFPLDELKIDPLTLDGLHMLNDHDMLLADPATEDAFRLDRL